MTRPIKPANFRNLTIREVDKYTMRPKKWLIPSAELFIDWLDKAVQFKSKEKPQDIEVLRIYWKYTTEFKTRQRIFLSWLHNRTFALEYAQWALNEEIEANKPKYNYGEKPGDAIPIAEPVYDYDDEGKIIA